METFAVRLKPNTDLLKGLETYARELGLQAGAILTCVGSLNNVSLRLAGSNETKKFEGPFEIISVSGTFSTEAANMHIAVADKEGKMMGGQLMYGSEVFTTAEVVMGCLNNMFFTRPVDRKTGHHELNVIER